MQVFIRIAERGSFTRAAEDLQIPRATVTNLLKRMEERLGTRLLERTARTVRLTHDGEAFYRRCVHRVADMEEAEGSFRNVAPKGLLRVNVQGTLAKHFVVPSLPDFVAQYPDIELHIGEDDRLVDLVREGIDCVLRRGRFRIRRWSGGTCTHWKAPPFHGAHPSRPFGTVKSTGCNGGVKRSFHRQ